MRKLILMLVLALFVAMPADAQNREKKPKFIEDTVWSGRMVKLLQNSYFTLKADRMVLSGHGSIPFMNSAINFIKVEGDEGVFQIAFDGPAQMYNGLGGQTLEGLAVGKDIKVLKKNRVSYNFMINGSGMSASIQIIIEKDNDEVTAAISPTFYGGTIRYIGKLYFYEPGENPHIVFQGNSTR